MRALKIFLVICFAIVFLAGAGIWVFLKTFDIQKFRPQIIEAVSRSVGREVALGGIDLTVSWRNGLTLVAFDLSIPEDPEFSSKPFLTARRLLLNIDVPALILDRTLLVTAISLEAPQVRIIRDPNGAWNVTGLGADSSDSTSPQASPAQPTSAGSPPLLPVKDITIRSLGISEGVVEFVDRAVQPPVTVSARQIDFQVNDIGLDRAFPFSLKAALWNEQQNIKASGRAQVDLGGKTVRIAEGALSLSLSDIRIDRLVRSLPALEILELQAPPEGRLDIRIEEVLVAFDKGLQTLSAQLDLQDGKVLSGRFPQPITDITVSAGTEGPHLLFKEFSLVPGSGTVRGQGKLKDYLQGRRLEFNIDISSVQLKELIPEQGGIQPVGTVFAEFSGTADAADPGQLAQTVNAQGTARVEEGVLKGINLLRTVLDKISLIPDLAERLETNLPERYRQRLENNETRLQEVRADFVVRDGDAEVRPLTVKGDGFSLTANARVDLEQNLFFVGDVTIPAELSQSMVETVAPLAFFLDAEGEIYIPLKEYRGGLKGFRPFPDMEYLGKRFMQQKGRDELQKFLKDVMGTEEEPAQDASADPPEGATPPKQEKSREERLIENVLDTIFR